MSPSRKSARRVRFEVLPDGDGGWSVTRDSVVIAEFGTKAQAVAYAAGEGRKLWKRGTPAQLLIKGRDGRIVRHGERTYGRDPRHIPG